MNLAFEFYMNLGLNEILRDYFLCLDIGEATWIWWHK